ncbi:mucin-5AC-like [Mixophyes fleayi]|uniref:mucin-5AC-like n=1 Tax=Mixophyes fleayi TaxID=3061075 RepID=UPI003F4DEEC0
MAITCRSVRFPYVPFTELQYKTQCDVGTGLICLNKDNVDKCVDFEIQLLCCPCELVPDLPEDVTTPVPTVYTVPPPSNPPCTAPCTWTQWYNVDHPTDQPDGGDWETLDNIRAHGYKVCLAPTAITCRSVRFPYVPFTELQYKMQCDVGTGLICLNKDNVDKCVDFEIQLLCCPCDLVPDSPEDVTTLVPTVYTESTASPCQNPQCTWTQWFNTHQPTTGPDGGDFETLKLITDRGYPVCAAPSAVRCRLARFPYIPLEELYNKQECSVSNGLICLNKYNQSCLDYEIQFLCCNCDVLDRKSIKVLSESPTQPATAGLFEGSAQKQANDIEPTARMTAASGIQTPDDGSGMVGE